MCLVQATDPEHALDLPVLPQPAREPSLPTLSLARHRSLELAPAVDEVVSQNDEDGISVEVVDAELMQRRLLGRPVWGGLGLELVVVHGLAQVLDAIEVVDR